MVYWFYCLTGLIGLIGLIGLVYCSHMLRLDPVLYIFRHVETSREAFTTVDSSSRNSHMKKFQFFSIWLSRHPHFSGGKRIGHKHVYMLQPISSHSNFPPSVFSPAFLSHITRRHQRRIRCL